MPERSKTEHFGEHLMIDGYGGDPEKLNDLDRVTACLSEFPEMLGMKILGGPDIFHCEGNGHKDPGGWTGVVAVNESHISVHTFVGRGFVSVDVYTCKNGLNQDFIVDYFKKQFDLKDVEVNFVQRGTRYPVENLSKALLQEQRA